MFKNPFQKNSPRAQNTVFDVHPGKSSGWNRPREVVSLRRQFYRKHPIKTSLVALVLVLATVFAADTFLGHANTVYWYPKSCLGGWSYVEKAAGAPELPPGASVDEFTANNSAVLKDTVSQIFCGQFGGDTPEAAVPVSVTLDLSLALKTLSESAATEQPDVPVNTSQEIPVASTTATESVSSSTDGISPESPAPTSSEPEPMPEPASTTEPTPVTEPAPQPEPISTPEPTPTPEPAPVPEPTPEPVPATSLFRIVPLAFAQEASTSLEVAPEPASIEPPAAAVDTTTTSEPQTPVEGTSTVEETNSVAETTSTSAVPAERSILEVKYSIDGENWQTLGVVGEFGWQNAQFSIPLTSWEDLKKLQISLVSLPVADAAPVVYLDGMSIAIDYAPLVPPAGYDFAISNVVMEVTDGKEAKIDQNVLISNPPIGAGELQFFAVPGECFGDLSYIKSKIITKPYCGDPIGFPIFSPENYSWQLNRPIRIAIGACRSATLECDNKPENFIIGFVSEQTLTPDLPAGRYELLPLGSQIASSSVPNPITPTNATTIIPEVTITAEQIIQNASSSSP